MHKIAELQEAIEREDQKQAECLESIKSRSEAYAIVRYESKCQISNIKSWLII